MPITLLVDDQDPQIQYLCPSSHQTVSGSYYNNTWTIPQSEECKEGWFEYVFYGTRVHVAASVAPDAEYLVKLDDGPFMSQSAGDGSFTSSTLTDGKHTITYAAVPGQLPPILDYLTVTAGSLTPLKGRTVVADDTDDGITYSGTWSNGNLLGVPFDYSTSFYNNSTHWSRSNGDNFRFEFEGTSISIYGIVANISSGTNITAEYVIDGVSRIQGLPIGTLDSLPMLELFHADVEPGNHTFAMNVTGIQAPQALGIDFIAYNTSAEIIASSGNPRASHQIPPWAPKVIASVSSLAVILLLGSFALIWCRRKRAKTQQPSMSNNVHTIEFGSKSSVESLSKK
ncbi:hypothetical protein CVT24_001370 [Panaeolus cyanescens]|uniref:Uncharacterized protein n=1 Tax=Panaeolus cyanescens TaxID=181874 RepID=A0A409VTN4_9AGAR|nr:hypothetical protein CVT24_001370 [Panaeolus cyanescens]